MGRPLCPGSANWAEVCVIPGLSFTGVRGPIQTLSRQNCLRSNAAGLTTFMELVTSLAALVTGATPSV